MFSSAVLLPVSVSISAASCSKKPSSDNFNKTLKEVAKKMHKFYEDWSPSGGQSKTFANFVSLPQSFPIFAGYVSELILGEDSGTYTGLTAAVLKYFKNSANQYPFSTTNWNEKNYTYLVDLVSRSVIYLIGSVLVAYASYKYEKDETITDTSSSQQFGTGSYWGGYMSYFSTKQVMPLSFINLLNATIHANFVNKSGVFIDRYFTHDWKINFQNQTSNTELLNLHPLAYNQNIPTATNPLTPLNGLDFQAAPDFLFTVNFDAKYNVIDKNISLSNYYFKLQPPSYTPNNNVLALPANLKAATNTIYDQYKTWYPKQAADKNDLLTFYNQLSTDNKNLYLQVLANISNDAALTAALQPLNDQLGNWTSAQKTAAIGTISNAIKNIAILKFSCLLVYSHQQDFAFLTKGNASKVLSQLLTQFTNNKFLADNSTSDSFLTSLTTIYNYSLTSPRNLYTSSFPLFKFIATPLDLSNVKITFTAANTYPTADAPTNFDLTFGALKQTYNLNLQFALVSSNLVANNANAFTY